MVVKVIGKDPSAIKWITCKQCASILEYVESDTRDQKIYDYTGDCTTYSILDCPECLNEIRLRGI